MVQIDTTDVRQRWRLKCPECGSENWRCNDGSFTCRSCDTKLDGLHDAKTDQFLERDQIQFVGPHANWKAKYPDRRNP